MSRRGDKDITFDDVQINYTLEIVEDDSGTKLAYRSNLKTEFTIVKEVFLRREYQKKGLEVLPEDVVMDLGG